MLSMLHVATNAYYAWCRWQDQPVHSDQGSQYTATRFKALVAQHGALQSMSRRGNCYDNAHAESF